MKRLFGIILFCLLTLATTSFADDNYNEILIDKLDPTVSKYVNNHIIDNNIYQFLCINGTIVIFPRRADLGCPIQLLNTQGFPMRCKNYVNSNR